MLDLVHFMPHRTGIFCAFNVSDALSANAYNQLQHWFSSDSSSHFVDTHIALQECSDREDTLKPRLHAQLSVSKHLILFLSSQTTFSHPLREAVGYSINTLGLPVIIIYPEYSTRADITDTVSKKFHPHITALWDRLLIFSNSMIEVPSIHIPFDRLVIENALYNPAFQVATKATAGVYFSQI